MAGTGTKRRVPWGGGSLRPLTDDVVVEDDNVALVHGRGELGLDVGVEGRPVPGLVKDPGRAHAITAQAGDEGLRSPMGERRLGGRVPCGFASAGGSSW